jgi:putative ABC transport system substrate-binding protein
MQHHSQPLMPSLSRRCFLQGTLGSVAGLAALCGLAAAGLPVLAGWEQRAFAAEPSKRLPCIGYLAFPVVGTDIDFATDVMIAALRDIGYVHGKTAIIEARSYPGRVEQLPQLVAELLALPVDILLPWSWPAIRACKAATTTVPIVMGALAGDPVEAGIVASFARPGGNITGVTGIIGVTYGKILEIFKQAFPAMRRVAVMRNPDEPSTLSYFQSAQAAAPALGMELYEVHSRDLGELERAFATLERDRPDGVLMVTDPFLFSVVERLVDFFTRIRLPNVWGNVRYARDYGGLLSYGADGRDVHGRMAVLVDKILKGAKPADLPIEVAPRLRLVVNLKAARAMDLEIAPTVLALADVVVR